MNNDIKKILDKLKEIADTSLFVVCSSQEELDKMPKSVCKFLSINDKHAKLLLDYITNLQEELNELKEAELEYHELLYKSLKFISNLQKEKSILEKSLKLIWKKDIKIDYEELDKANKDIEKALNGGDE